MSKHIENVLPQVKEQYEEFPYPLRDPEREKQILVLTNGSRFDIVNHACFGGRQDFKNFRVLIAGGGTGDGVVSWAENLRDMPNSEVVYLDMSAKSLSIAKERVAVRKLNNVTWLNDSLLNVGQLGLGEFDFIDCSGVLHHLADPDAGLKALKSVLKPDGAMFIMVYAKYGRSAVYIIQELMRMVNGDEQNPHTKIANTRTILESLPSQNIFNVLRGLKLWNFNDTQYDAGIYDLFLHTQDRAYTILEVHDWLERCGMQMAVAPGEGYQEKEYEPESYIREPKLLEKIKTYPVKVQQAIAEAMSTNLSKHSIFVTHAGRACPAAKITDKDMVLSFGVTHHFNLEEVATVALQRNDSFTVTNEKHPMQPKLEIPAGKYVASLLRQIDGKRTVGEVLTAVKESPKWKDKPVDDALLMQELEALAHSLRRGNMVFLRHTSVPPYMLANEMQKRVVDMYRKK